MGLGFRAIIGLVAGLFLAGANPSGLSLESRASPDGLGALRIGLSVAEAERVLGAPLALDPPAEVAAPCHRAWPSAGQLQIRLVVVGDAVVRIDIDDPDLETERGVRIGDREEQLRLLYGPALIVKPSATMPGWRALVVPSADGKHALLFETDGDSVIRYRVGERAIVEPERGCP